MAGTSPAMTVERACASKTDLAPGASRSCSLPSPFALEMRDQERERRRRHAVDAAGLADGARADRLQLLLGLVGEPRELRIVEPIGQFEALIAPIGSDIGGLP